MANGHVAQLKLEAGSPPRCRWTRRPQTGAENRSAPRRSHRKAATCLPVLLPSEMYLPSRSRQYSYTQDSYNGQRVGSHRSRLRAFEIRERSIMSRTVRPSAKDSSVLQVNSCALVRTRMRHRSNTAARQGAARVIRYVAVVSHRFLSVKRHRSDRIAAISCRVGALNKRSDLL